jgi:hypothetical protein
MRHLFTLLLLLCFANLLPGQTFFPNPAALKTQEIQPGLANEVFLYFSNPSGDSLRLRWRALEINMPGEWDADLCDFGHCYTGIPANALMNWASGADVPYLKLILQPGATPGVAWMWFRVEQQNNPANFQDVFFSLYTPGLTSGTEAAAAADLLVYPNPAQQQFTLHNRYHAAQQVRVYNSSGQLFHQINIAPDARAHIGAGDWPAGPYFIQYQQHIQTLILR